MPPVLRFFSPAVSQRLLLAQQIREFERLAPAQQLASQSQQLFTLLKHAWTYSLFWRERLQQAGFDPEQPLLEAFQRLPPLAREILQENPEALRARWPGLQEDQVSTAVTSGSTGKPVRVERAIQIYEPLYGAIGWVDYLWHGQDASRPIAILGVGGKDAIWPSWGGLYTAQGLNGLCHKRALVGQSLESHVAWLLEVRPDYLVCSPMLAAEVAHYVMQYGIALPLLQIISKSERVTARQRDLCARAFGAKIVDRYSCEEAGWIALQCPEHDHLHVLNGSVLLEIVDTQGNPCPPGQIGRVLLTSLHSFAMPLIRYELGDLAEWGEACSCGMTLPVIRRLWGRVRQQVLMPAGVPQPMPFLGDDLGKLEVIRSFRIIQYAGKELELQVQATRSLSDSERTFIRDIFFSNGLADLPLYISEVEQIAWPEGCKREEFIRVDYEFLRDAR